MRQRRGRETKGREEDASELREEEKSPGLLVPVVRCNLWGRSGAKGIKGKNLNSGPKRTKKKGRKKENKRTWGGDE